MQNISQGHTRACTYSQAPEHTPLDTPQAHLCRCRRCLQLLALRPHLLLQAGQLRRQRGREGGQER